MKSFLILLGAVIFFCLSTLEAREITLSKYKKLFDADAVAISQALIIDNDENPIYGSCNLDFTTIPNKEVYVNTENTSPVIIVLFNSTKSFLAISSDLSRRNITGVISGQFRKKLTNNGTLTNPLFEVGLELSNVFDCKN